MTREEYFENLNSVNVLQKQKAKNDNKLKVQQTYDHLNERASKKENFWYNNATRKKAAKYIVNNNMTIEQATKKAQGDAKRNIAAMLAIYGSITMAELYALRKF